MTPLRVACVALPLALAVLGAACGTSTPSTPALTQVALPPWDGGADAGCSIDTTSIRVQCTMAYRIEGDPYACVGFDSQGMGSTAACTAACHSGLVCSLSGLSDGTYAVVCQTGCASPEH
jgi:hypothetical protein